MSHGTTSSAPPTITGSSASGRKSEAPATRRRPDGGQREREVRGAQPDRLLAREVGQAEHEPEGHARQHARAHSSGRDALAAASARGMSRAASTPKTRKGVVESGTAAATTNGPSTAATRPLPAATARGADGAELGHPGRLAADRPGQGRDEGAKHHAAELRRGEGCAEDRHRRGRREAGHRQPQLEGRLRQHQRRSGVAPDRVAHHAVALDQVARHVHVVGAALGGREGDRRCRDQAHEERDAEQRDRREPRAAPDPRHGAHRVSAGSKHTA